MKRQMIRPSRCFGFWGTTSTLETMLSEPVDWPLGHISGSILSARWIYTIFCLQVSLETLHWWQREAEPTLKDF